MALYLVTSLFDEGMYESDFQVVEAQSKLEIAQHMLSHPHQWENYLSRAYPRNWRDHTFNVGSLWDCVHSDQMTPDRLLGLIDMTSVDGDSTSQLRIFEIQVQQLSEVDTNPFKRKIIPIVHKELASSRGKLELSSSGNSPSWETTVSIARSY